MDRKGEDAAFMAGLLHDIGKLLTAAYLPDSFTAVANHMQTHGVDMAEAEAALIGTNHGAIGAYLLGLWGLPRPIVEAAAFHHTPADAPGGQFNPAVIVHVADVFAIAGTQGLQNADAIQGLDLNYLGDAGVLPNMPRWQRICLEKMSEA